MTTRPPKKRTAAQERHMQGLFEALWELRADFCHPDLIPGLVPPEWRNIDMDTVQEKVRMTIRLDEDVAKFYRGLGPGFQTKMNLVLRAYMLGYLSDTLGRVSGEVEVVPDAELTEDQKFALRMEGEYARMVKDYRQDRVLAKERPKRRHDD